MSKKKNEMNLKGPLKTGLFHLWGDNRTNFI